MPSDIVNRMYHLVVLESLVYPLTTITDVLTASEMLCRSSAAVPGLLRPRVNFLASGGAGAIAETTSHQTAR